MATLIKLRTFADIAPVGPPVGDNFVPVSASSWSVNSSGVLTTTTQNPAQAGVQLLFGGTGQQPNDALVTVKVQHAAAAAIIVLRSDGTLNNCYILTGTGWDGSGGQGKILKVVGGTVTTLAGFQSFTGSQTRDFFLVGEIKGSTLTLTARWADTPDTIVQTWTATDASLATGSSGLGANDSTTKFLQAGLYDFSDGVVPAFSTSPLAPQLYPALVTAAGANFTWGSPTGGSGTYNEIDLYRSDNSDFSSPTLAATFAGSARAGADTTCPTDKAQRWWFLKVIDSNSVTSAAGIGCSAYRPSATALKRLCAGTSFEGITPSLPAAAITDANYSTDGPFTPLDHLVRLYLAGLAPDGIPRCVTITNGAVSGAQSGDWLTNIGQAGSYTGNLKANAITAGTNTSDAIIHVILGLNDLWANVSPATYGVNMTTLLNWFLANMLPNILVHYCPSVVPGTNGNLWNQGHFAVLTQYNAQLETVVATINSARLKMGSRRMTKITAALSTDWYFNSNGRTNGHPTPVGGMAYGAELINSEFGTFLPAVGGAGHLVGGGLVQ